MEDKDIYYLVKKDEFENDEGYDPYCEILNKINSLYAPSEFSKMTEEERLSIVEKVLNEVRKINKLPIKYYTDTGVRNEIEKIMRKDVSINGNIIRIFNTDGLVVLDFLFQNLHHAKAGSNSNPSIYEIFYDDDKLKWCLEDFMQNNYFTSMRTAFMSRARYKWNAATNFNPCRAKAIYERCCPKDGVIYDYCAGFGGRMLGALSSKNNYKYICTDPNTETYANLCRLGRYIEDVSGRNNSFEIFNECSEDVVLPAGSVDFAFSCPPFFDLERYCNEETQSTIKYPNYEQWLENFTRKTIRNCFNALKDDGIFGVDLMNFSLRGIRYDIIDDWRRIAEEEGFYLSDVLIIDSHSRKNFEDRERVMLFSKKEENKLPPEKLEEIEGSVSEQSIKKQTYICEYDIYGNKTNVFLSYSETGEMRSDITKSIKRDKNLNGKFYRIYASRSEIEEKIKPKGPIILIDGIIFDSYAKIGKHIGVSRQAVEQCYKRMSEQINGKSIKIIC